jgi:hypothetical protein
MWWHCGLNANKERALSNALFDTSSPRNAR